MTWIIKAATESSTPKVKSQEYGCSVQSADTRVQIRYETKGFSCIDNRHRLSFKFKATLTMWPCIAAEALQREKQKGSRLNFSELKNLIKSEKK